MYTWDPNKYGNPRVAEVASTKRTKRPHVPPQNKDSVGKLETSFADTHVSLDTPSSSGVFIEEKVSPPSMQFSEAVSHAVSPPSANTINAIYSRGSNNGRRSTTTPVQDSPYERIPQTDVSRSLNIISPSTPHESMWNAEPGAPADDVDNVDLLQNLQYTLSQEIVRNSQTKHKDAHKNQTTSLRDLDLARRPVNPRQPRASIRRWAQPPDSDNGSPQNSEEGILAGDDKSQQSCGDPKQSKIQANQPDDLSNKRNSKWATRAEMEVEKVSTDSNAWGSANPSDATKDSNASMEQFGKLLHKMADDQYHPTLVGWDGNFAPAPAEWSQRPRFNNNHSAFKEAFEIWQTNVRQLACASEHRLSNGVPVHIIPANVLSNLNLVPDGLSMVNKTASIDSTNCEYYGYTNSPRDATKYSQAIQSEDYDVDWGKLDLTDPDNEKIRNETTEHLVNNWLSHTKNQQKAHEEIGRPPRLEGEGATIENETTFCTYVPKLNFYIRPATKLDLAEMTRIYNEHIVNGVAPCETFQIGIGDMQARLDMCADSLLPCIVAAKKNQKGAKKRANLTTDDPYRESSLPVTHRKPISLMREEILVGFGCANDFSTADYVEHISADLEVYVDPQYRRMGIGTCLMDKMLQICDVGHAMKSSFEFHCDPSLRHLYGPGGGRNLHKLVLILRKWSIPKLAILDVHGKRKHSKSAQVKTSEDDYSIWLKQWLENWGFEVEGTLKKVGAKHGRYIDIVHLGLETSWAPSEGHVPGPDPRFIVEADHTEDDET